MSTTLLNVNTTINDRRRDTGATAIDMTGNGFRAVTGALQLWNMGHEWPWQKEKVQITYNEGISWYALPSNFKAVLDLKPTRPPQKDEFEMVTNNSFDSNTLIPYRFAVANFGQTQYLRCKYSGTNGLVNAATSATNGTWTASGAVSNISSDQYEFFDLSASVKFDYSGTSGTISTTLPSNIDVSRYAQRGTFYVNVYLQTVSNFTSMAIKVGNGASNYLTGTVTTDYLGNSLVAGWNRVKLTWDGNTTVVGTLTNTTFAYTALTIAYGSTTTTYGNRVENFFVAENIPLELDWYSSFMVTTSGGTKTQIFSNSASTSDLFLWTGEWDWATEEFVNSAMEIVSFITGEYADEQIAVQKIREQVELLKKKVPSGKRYPRIAMTVNINEVSRGRTTNPQYPFRWWSN